MWAPNHFDSMNEIFDLQRDLHANDFAPCEAYPLGVRTFLFALFLLSERVALLSMDLVPPHFDAATFCVCVLAVGMRPCVSHGLLVPLESPASSLAFWIMALNCSTLAGGQSWIFLGWCAAFILGFSVSHCCFAFLCAHLDIDEHTSGRIISGLDVTCVLVNLPSTHESPWGGPLFRMRNLGAPLQLSERVLLPSLFPKSSMPLCKIAQFVFFISHDVNVFFFSEELGMMALSVHTLVLWTCHGGDN